MRMVDNIVGYGTHDCAPHFSQASGSHDDQVGLLFIGYFDDGLTWAAVENPPNNAL